jgi:hypothetical protein
MPTIQEKLSKNKPIQRFYTYLIGFGLPLMGIILLILPASFFDDGPPLCLSVLVAGIECYACGMTRGIMHLIHFDFHTAWDYNPLAFLVFPLAFFLLFKEWIKRLKMIRSGEFLPNDK